MRWYDLMALFYDGSLETRYREPRAKAVSLLNLEPGMRVLDMACGTAQNLPMMMEVLATHEDQDGQVVGVDASAGMLRQAHKRIRRQQWSGIHLHQASVHDFDDERLHSLCGHRQVDAVICALGMTVFPQWREAFERMHALLRPGGCMVVMDAFLEDPTMKDWRVKFYAQADVTRPFWEPLETHMDQYQRIALGGNPKHFGGTLYAATGIKRSDGLQDEGATS